MSSQQLVREFLGLNKFDRLSLLTVRLRAKRYVGKILKKIDHISPNFTSVFFAYELLERMQEGLSEDFAGNYQLVMAYSPNRKAFQRLLREVGVCNLVELRDISVGELYRELSRTYFRVEKELVFERLSVKRFTMKFINNPFGRMLMEQNVLCLYNLSLQENAAKQWREKFHLWRQNDHINDIRAKQRRLQRFLYGQHNSSTQIHLPQHEIDNIFHMLEQTSRQKMEIESSEMDCERDMHQLTTSIQGLHLNNE